MDGVHPPGESPARIEQRKSPHQNLDTGLFIKMVPKAGLDQSAGSGLGRAQRARRVDAMDGVHPPGESPARIPHKKSLH